ncbi:MAG: polyprenyl synthetase family protein [Thermodesulfobacteriota bacterium]
MKDIFAPLSQDMQAIERALADNLEPHVPLVKDVAGHILFSGGKRIRPLLMVLCARMCGRDGKEVHGLSTVFEYLHAATLLHDDVVDAATTRRGQPAAYTLFGGAVTILTGDFLFARTCSLATATGKLPVIQTITDVTGVMSEGEIAQIGHRGDAELSEAQYMEVITAKTAALTSAACRVGALFADAAEEKVKALTDFGLYFGLSFQIVDDLLDYTADPGKSGKKLGADLREGKMTLPLIYTRQKADGETRAFLDQVIRCQDPSPDDFSRVVAAMERFGGLSGARDKARELVCRAKDGLAVFPPSPSRQILTDLADFVISRDR